MFSCFMDVATFHALNIIFILRMAFYQTIDEFISNIGENIEVTYVIIFSLFDNSFNLFIFW